MVLKVAAYTRCIMYHLHAKPLQQPAWSYS